MPDSVQQVCTTTNFPLSRVPYNTLMVKSLAQTLPVRSVTDKQ